VSPSFHPPSCLASSFTLSLQRYIDVREYFESLVAERASGKGNWSTLTQTRDGKLRVYLRWPDADTTGACSFH
jgi:hypothetical protein